MVGADAIIGFAPIAEIPEERWNFLNTCKASGEGIFGKAQELDHCLNSLIGIFTRCEFLKANSDLIGPLNHNVLDSSKFF